MKSKTVQNENDSQNIHVPYVKNCSDNQEAIYCTSCLNWVHCKCNGTSKTEYVKLTNEPDGDLFHCMLCIMKENSNVPFLLF